MERKRSFSITTRALFHSGVLDFFKQQKGWSVEGGEDWLIVYKPSKRVRPEEINRFLETTTSVLRLFQSSG